MPKHGKRYQTAASEVGDDLYSPEEAAVLAKKIATAKFDEAVELHIATSADPRHADQQIREVAELPHGTGKQVRIMVFADGEAAAAAIAAGADFVADDETIKRIEGGWSDFDIAIATTDQMAKIGRLGRYLGRKGLMPNPRTGTVVAPDEIGNAVSAAKRGRSEVRMDKQAIIHTRIGVASFSEQQIVDNMASVYSTVVRAKPEGIKGTLVKSATLTTTMGPGIKLDLSALEAVARSV
ncbi:MAG: 50S ribosomal protein L1 [Chloroflexi bacterium]|nr:50S ribosomal protein L1 [Chloroflexota bacterium]MDA1298261.1 50S ribosomal protein L1 [Chloroflexota bacterium]